MMRKIGLILLIHFGLVNMVSQSAMAQSWIGTSGEGSIQLNYSYYTSNTIVWTPPLEFDQRDLSRHTTSLDLQYTLLDRWSVSTNIPVHAIKWKGGDNGYGDHGAFDDGTFNNSLGDINFETAYMLIEEPLAISPHIGISTPLSDYATKGYAALGRGVTQFHLGVNLGYEVYDQFYLTGRYQFSLATKPEVLQEDLDNPEASWGDVNEFNNTIGSYGQNSSRANLSFIYAGVPNLALFANLDFFAMHSGVTFEESTALGGIVEEYHDVLLKERALQLGLGLSYRLLNQVAIVANGKQNNVGVNDKDWNKFYSGARLEL